ncbi:hypothetical protein KAS45_07240 [candidate division WOR-3 bacterium]|nr:hypothetical protein [candidate division WOR-3 bacterium]
MRLVANRITFQSFLIEELWVTHPYFIYVYRILGAFVVLVGVTLFIMARDPDRYAVIMRAWGIGFLVICIIMFSAGWLVRLSIIHYLPDFSFCFVVGLFCIWLSKRHR